MAEQKKIAKEGKGNIYLPYGKKAYFVQGAGLLLGILGFVLTGMGDITYSVIFMVLGLVVLLPIGLWMKGR